MTQKKPTGDLLKELDIAFQESLRRKFGEVIGGLLGDVATYYHQTTLEPAQLREILDTDVGAAVNAIVANKGDGSTMRLIRDQMVGSALIMDKDGVTRWATEGLNRCERAGGLWKASPPQWRWVLEDPDRYILYARQVKRFLHQI